VLIAGTRVEPNINRIGGPIQIVDLATGNDTQPPLPLEQTEETLDTPWRIGQHFFPRAGRILTLRSDDVLEVWDVPPRRSYIAVIVTAAILAALGTLWCGIPWLARRLWSWLRQRRRLA
jgi:hypothetical protein